MINKYLINNPIYFELKKLKLILDKNIELISKKTRDKNISVLVDVKTKIIFLSKYITGNKHYFKAKYEDNPSVKKNLNKRYFHYKNRKNKFKSSILEDDVRRANQFKNLIKNKKLLDFGCGWGGFLSNAILISKFKKICGVEIREECLKYLKKKNEKISNKKKCKFF